MADEETQNESADETPVAPEPEAAPTEAAAEAQPADAAAEPAAAEPAAAEPAPAEAAAELGGRAAGRTSRLPRSLPPPGGSRQSRGSRGSACRARCATSTRSRALGPGERKPIIRTPKPESEPGRRQERRGVVVSDKGDKTIVVKVELIKAHPKYKKVVRRRRKFHAHDEQNTAAVGDVVRIVETRPLSKTKHWRLAEIVEKAR